MSSFSSSNRRNKILDMNDSIKKLNEAIFFFNKTKENFNDSNREWEFYLSAFVAAARTVTPILKTEFSSNQIFTEWWKLHKENYLYQKFNDLRVILLHRSYAKVSQKIEINLGPDGLTIPGNSSVELPLYINGGIIENFSFQIPDEDGTTKRVSAQQTRSLVITDYRNDKKVTNREIKFDDFLSDARAYLDLLKDIVMQLTGVEQEGSR